MNAPRSCELPRCLVKRIARNWNFESGRIRVQLCETLSLANQSLDLYNGSLRGLCPTSVWTGTPGTSARNTPSGPHSSVPVKLRIRTCNMCWGCGTVCLVSSNSLSATCHAQRSRCHPHYWFLVLWWCL